MIPYGAFLRRTIGAAIVLAIAIFSLGLTFGAFLAHAVAN